MPDYQHKGPSAATGVTVTDTLPSGVVFVTSTPSCTLSGGKATCDLGSLGSGATTTLTIQVRVHSTTTGAIINTATVAADQADPDITNNAAAEATTAIALADLSVSKLDAPDPVIAGNELTYTMTVANAGPSAATGLVLTDTLPVGVSFVSSEPACSASGGVVTCSLGDLSRGATSTVTVQAAVDPATRGAITNTVEVAGNQTDPDPGNNATIETTEATAEADLSVSKIDSPDPVLAGATLTYSLTVSNRGPSAATGVTLIDTLPPNVTFASSTPACSAPAGTVVCTLGELGPGQAVLVTLQVVVSPSTPGTIINTATVEGNERDSNAFDNADTEVTVVIGRADLSVTKTDSPDPAPLGGILTYTLTVTNNGPSDATGLIVTDTLPDTVEFVHTTPDAPTCSPFGGVVTCLLDRLASGSTTVVTIQVEPQKVGTIFNRVEVSGNELDPDPGNNTDIEPTEVVPAADLSVTKSDAPDPVLVGNVLTYTLTVTNNGPSVATEVTLTDTLPQEVSFVSSTPDFPTCTEFGGIVACDIEDLANGASTVVTIQVTAPDAAGTITNTAKVTGKEGDLNAENDTATTTTDVIPSADLAVTKTDSRDPVPLGSDFSYTLTVTNNGPSDATGVVLRDTLPAGVPFVPDPAGESSCEVFGGLVICEIGQLASGAQASVTFRVTALAAVTTTTNTVEVSGNETDPFPDNNIDAEDTRIVPAVDLALSKAGTPEPVVAGGSLSYTLTVANVGQAAASEVRVEDVLPVGVTFVSSIPACSLSPNPPKEGVGSVS